MIDVSKCDNCNFYGCKELQIQTGLNKYLREQLQRTLEENKQLKEWKKANRATGICETCTEKSVMELDKLRKENEELKNKLNSLKRMQAEVNIKSRKLKKIKECVNKACINGCKCIDKIDILKILEEE